MQGETELAEKTLQRMLLVRPAQLVERSAFDLSHPFAGQTHHFTNFPQGLGLIIGKTEP
jgi:hypothetical protein